MAWTVFYAWQSDRPGNVNRSLIQRALEAAIAEVRADGALDVDPRLDRDTLDVAGAPDIVATIFSKIDHAAVFVADVTLVTTDARGRPSPNPNVLIELGYALKALGWERVVLVMNTAFGGPEELPFDIRQKRAVTYRIADDAPEKAPERRRLQSVLVDAVRMGLAATEKARPAAPTPPSPGQALVVALEQNLPAKRNIARRYLDAVLREIEHCRPSDPSSDETLVESINTTRELVAGFATVAESVGTHQSSQVTEEVMRGFERLLASYDVQRGFAGSFRRTDFDFWKFVGHELFAILTAAFLREEAWPALDQLLRLPLSVTTSSRSSGVVSFTEISAETMMLDVTRRDRLKSPSAGSRISIRADMLKERYAAGPLAVRVGWEAFMDADLFLYLRARCSDAETHERGWWPWSVLYMERLPAFIQRAESRSYAQRVAEGLGVADVGALPVKLRDAIADLRTLYDSIAWRAPGQGFDWSRVGTR